MLLELLKNQFKDNKGKIVIGQSPNIPLIGFLVFSTIQLFTNNSNLYSQLNIIKLSFIFLWSYLELTDGTNNFRKFLGLLGMIYFLTKIFS